MRRYTPTGGWPLRRRLLQRAPRRALTFDQAIAAAGNGDGPGTLLRTHGRRTDRAVLLLHGYTHSPRQVAALAELFYEGGCTVYAPTAPRHGTAEPGAHRGFTAAQLLRYAGEALDVAAALGEEVGVVGVSAGAALATWLGAHRGDQVARLLLITPLFAPHAGRVPAALLRPLTTLYGLRLPPDRVNERGYSFTAVAQYLRVAANLPAAPVTGALRHVAVVTSPGDTVVDATRAEAVPAWLAAAAGATFVHDVLPAGEGHAHNVIGEHASALNERYLRLYQG
ncbi:alpha/beta hydrolase [Dactylosporangium sp. NBC_01737]|uniref:alpha/beta hydrolase n=1 Tax=Dactylosporangium sp. NBC_01737 TaxID=2975959 RepID=UPI002E15B639|nr:alpha/beta hydrolase [Dactylosporangium sp. NBC_01737]